MIRSSRVVAGAGLAMVVIGGLLLVRSAARPGAEVVSETAAHAYVPRFTADVLDHLLEPVREQVELEAFAGAAVAVGVRDREAVEIGVGRNGWTRNATAVDPDSTIYDLASMTKVLATASAILLLAEEGRLSLDDPAARFLPEFAEGPKAEVTIRQMLNHTSGLPAGAILRGETRAERLERAAGFPIYPPAGAREEYSDVGYVLLWEIAGRAAQEPVEAYLERKLYAPLGMTSTGFAPGLDCERCAPTGRLRDQSLYRGRPFDQIAQRLDGITGSAGLFSTARDVGRFAAMITSGGMLDGVRIFEEATVREFTSVQPPATRHGLGWEISCGTAVSDEGAEPTEPEDVCDPPRFIGHTGWTGTSLRIDLESGTWVVLLTNRTYEPRAPNRINDVRRALFERALALGGGQTSAAAGDTTN